MNLSGNNALLYGTLLITMLTEDHHWSTGYCLKPVKSTSYLHTLFLRNTLSFLHSPLKSCLPLTLFNRMVCTFVISPIRATWPINYWYLTFSTNYELQIVVVWVVVLSSLLLANRRLGRASSQTIIIASNEKMVNELVIENGMEGNGHGLFKVSSPHLPGGTQQNHENSSSI